MEPINQKQAWDFVIFPSNPFSKHCHIHGNAWNWGELSGWVLIPAFVALLESNLYISLLYYLMSSWQSFVFVKLLHPQQAGCTWTWVWRLAAVMSLHSHALSFWNSVLKVSFCPLLSPPFEKYNFIFIFFVLMGM